jgi:hypothetical protein
VISGEGFRLGAEAAHKLALTGRFQMAPGLTDAEIDRVEREYGLEFADDHKAFLQAGLPVNKPPAKYQAWRHPWPDWRDGDPGELRERLSWPADGALFDVERNAFWHPTWGPRPADMNDALDMARRHLAHVPKMIPVYAHRYLPAGHGSYGHPVLSIYQTDIIIYGTDLADYMDQEFSSTGLSIDVNRIPSRLVPFWGDFR